ncbi:MAG: hypothetical protein OWR62_01195 [Sulfobacillus thermotolerans]|nr:hypothetical protein [Sulfobacillus thermotolerans]
MAEKKPRKPKTFAPSLSGRCLRYTVMDLLGFGRHIAPEALVAMHDGASLHKRFQQSLVDLYDVVGVEVPLKDPVLHVSGRIDAVLKEGDHQVAVEYKTVRDDKFAAVRVAGPFFDHWAQLALYVNIGGYDAGRLVVENRETNERLMWLQWPDVHWKSWLVQRINTAQTYQEKRTLPPREVSLNCRHCDRWQRCFNSEAEREAAIAEHPLWEPHPAAPEIIQEGDPVWRQREDIQ